MKGLSVLHYILIFFNNDQVSWGERGYKCHFIIFLKEKEKKGVDHDFLKKQYPDCLGLSGQVGPSQTPAACSVLPKHLYT